MSMLQGVPERPDPRETSGTAPRWWRPLLSLRVYEALRHAARRARIHRAVMMKNSCRNGKIPENPDDATLRSFHLVQSGRLVDRQGRCAVDMRLTAGDPCKATSTNAPVPVKYAVSPSVAASPDGQALMLEAERVCGMPAVRFGPTRAMEAVNGA
ncbi:hypothetical protein JSE7799_02523 [Jannaschia seosinensis]|uniref:Uncharacterized protein n=1 Tax=Jannaschia seosinensis TaxID=313367 RepID=A0A0M7BEK5_9RHOB|nr:hypothetical protein JSE7799_02523 [Jannaschia seosinensis]